jgi:misacylated tRNA(Ala) deacylase
VVARRAASAEDGHAAVALDKTAFYATGGGQPHDTGTLTVSYRGNAAGGADQAGGTAGAAGPHVVTDVRKEGELVWHTITGDAPAEGTIVRGDLDWDRRHKLMRTHTALHILCGVIWNEWQVPVTGGNMEPLSARMDFEFDPLPEGFAMHVERLVNDAIQRDYPIAVSFLPRAEAVLDADLIRTKVSLIPDIVKEIRVVDIVGLDKQADGGTHVRSTREVGTFRVVKTESKGKGNKRLRVEIG